MWGATLCVPAAGPGLVVKVVLGGPAALGKFGSVAAGRFGSGISGWMTGSPWSSTKGCVVVKVAAVVALLTEGWALVTRMGIAAFWVLGMGVLRHPDE